MRRSRGKRAAFVGAGDADRHVGGRDLCKASRVKALGDPGPAETVGEVGLKGAELPTYI